MQPLGRGSAASKQRQFSLVLSFAAKRKNKFPGDCRSRLGTLKNVARDFQEIIVRMISAVILPLLPLYIFGIFLNMTHSGQVYSILMVFIKIIGVIFLLHIFLLVFQYSIAALFVRRNPFKLLGRMLPAYFTALGTQSSAATIPVTLEQTKKNGVSVTLIL